MELATGFLLIFSVEVILGMIVATASHLAKWEAGVRVGLTFFGIGAVGMLILALVSFVDALTFAA